MSQKITLSIPDLLYEKLADWRSSFNLSRLFQEALTEAIQKKEEFQKRVAEDFDMKDIIKRLKQEKQNWEKKYFHLGWAEGLRWARLAHYTELLHVLNCKDMYQLATDAEMKDYFNHSCPTPDQPNSLSIYMDGWHKGVMEFWNHIKEKI